MSGRSLRSQLSESLNAEYQLPEGSWVVLHPLGGFASVGRGRTQEIEYAQIFSLRESAERLAECVGGEICPAAEALENYRALTAGLLDLLD